MPGSLPTLRETFHLVPSSGSAEAASSPPEKGDSTLFVDVAKGGGAGESADESRNSARADPLGFVDDSGEEKVLVQPGVVQQW